MYFCRRSLRDSSVRVGVVVANNRVKSSCSFGISSSVQPELLVVDANHSFVEYNLVQSFLRHGLYIGFLHPITDAFSTALDTQFYEKLKNLNISETFD